MPVRTTLNYVDRAVPEPAIYYTEPPAGVPLSNVRHEPHEVEIVDRLGAGVAFVAGLIHGLMNNDLQQGLDYGAAMGALKHTIPGDFPWLTKAEVEGVVSGTGLRIRR